MSSPTLLSGKVKKVPSNQVDSSRYDFLNLQNAEPDLGVPSNNNNLAGSDTDGSRKWINPSSGLNVDVSNNLTVDETTLSVDSSGLNSSTSSTLSGVLSDIDSALTFDGITSLGNTTTNSITVGDVTTTGVLAGPAIFTIDPAAVGDNTGTVVIAGNLQIDGTTTTINSTTLDVDDLNITLASGAPDAASANGAGITIDGANATAIYNASSDRWVFNKPIEASEIYGTAGAGIVGDGSNLTNVDADTLDGQEGSYYEDTSVAMALILG